MATPITNNPTPFTSLASGATAWDGPLDTWIAAASADITAVGATADAAAAAATAAGSGTINGSRLVAGSVPLSALPVDLATQAELDVEKARIDTAIANAAAAVTAATTPPTLPVKTIAGAYTFILADTDSLLKSTSATAVTYTIPLNSSVAFQVGRSIRGYQGAAGPITFAGAVGVTVNALGGLKTTGGQFAQWEAFKVGTNEWLVSGEMA